MMKAWFVVSKDDFPLLTHDDRDLTNDCDADTVIEEGFFITKKEHDEQLKILLEREETIFEYRAIVQALQEERNKNVKKQAYSNTAIPLSASATEAVENELQRKERHCLENAAYYARKKGEQ